MGACVSTHALRRPAGTIMELPAGGPESSAAGFRAVMSTKVGNHCPCLHERGRLHPRQETWTSCVERGLSQERWKGKQEERREQRGDRRVRSCSSQWPGSGPALPDVRDDIHGAAGGEDFRACGGPGVSPKKPPDDKPLLYGDHDEIRGVEKDAAYFFEKGFAFGSWADGQVRRILSSRTAFSFFCMRTQPPFSRFQCRTSRCGIWLEDEACQKLLNMAIHALNFEYLRLPLAVLPLLRRPPGPHHHRVYDRLLRFIGACATTERISFLGCGRISFQFGARINV